MEQNEIINCLKEQLGNPGIQNKKIQDNKLFILDGIMAGDLPVYRKWEFESMITETRLKWIFRIDIIQGRLEVDKIKFEDNGRVEFDTQNHGMVLDSDFKEASEDEWRNATHKLMKYLRNE